MTLALQTTIDNEHSSTFELSLTKGELISRFLELADLISSNKYNYFSKMFYVIYPFNKQKSEESIELFYSKARSVKNVNSLEELAKFQDSVFPICFEEENSDFLSYLKKNPANCIPINMTFLNLMAESETLNKKSAQINIVNVKHFLPHLRLKIDGVLTDITEYVNNNSSSIFRSYPSVGDTSKDAILSKNEFLSYRLCCSFQPILDSNYPNSDDNLTNIVFRYFNKSLRQKADIILGKW
ncbi:MAG: hypothetical protein WC755_01360 [Candidatus Woesearchaeota archaeon]|jgi:hypothetical protein